MVKRHCRAAEAVPACIVGVRDAAGNGGMIMKFRSRAILVACSAAAVVLPVAASASAATVSAPLVTGLAGPLGLAVGSGGTVYVSQAFSSPGLLTAVGGRGTRTVAEE